MLRRLAMVAALLLQPLAASAQEPQPGPRVGDTYEIAWARETSQSSTDGSSGSSNSRFMLLERVVEVRDTGVELEFDLPGEATAEDRARTWQYPVRVLRPSRGPLELLNGPELETRLEAWLRAANLPREACGRWYFTWDAFQIECDRQSVIQTLAALELRPELVDGGPYQEAMARGAGVLRREGANFVVELEVDPEAVRRQRAEGDVVVAEIMRERLTLEAALQAWSAKQVSGTITVTFETDAAGRVRRRTRVIRLAIVAPDGVRETETITETVERRQRSTQ